MKMNLTVFSAWRVSRMMKSIFGKLILTIPLILVLSCDTNDVVPKPDSNALFLDFSVEGQTLPTFIHSTTRKVAFEVDHDVDVNSLTSSFSIPEGYEVYANGIKQTSGSSKVDFAKPVTYQLKNAKTSTTTAWQVAAVSVSCKILIDASHDGGVWWYPQSEVSGFDSDKPHQGKDFADLLRGKGFEVTELGRGVELTEEMFFGHYIVIRAGGFQSYTNKELSVYTNLIDRGMRLVFFTDHKKYDPIDELGDHLGLQFGGIATGVVTTFAEHQITANMESMNYIGGSVLTNAEANANIDVLGWLNGDIYADLNFNGVQDENEPTGAPVMGILNYSKSKVFFIGDMNGIEVQPQPFIDNLIGWLGSCLAW